MVELEKETGQGRLYLFHGRIAQLLDQTAKNAGLAKTQYKEWGEEDGVDTKEYKRGRILSKRGKKRAGGYGRYYQEIREAKGERGRRTDEARGRTRKNEQEKQWQDWEKEKQEEEKAQDEQ